MTERSPVGGHPWDRVVITGRPDRRLTLAEVKAGSPGTHGYLPTVDALQSPPAGPSRPGVVSCPRGVASAYGQTMTVPDLCPGCGSVEILLTFKRTPDVREWVGRCSNCQKVWTFDP